MYNEVFEPKIFLNLQAFFGALPLLHTHASSILTCDWTIGCSCFLKMHHKVFSSFSKRPHFLSSINDDGVTVV